MKTSFTSGQLIKFARLLEHHEVNPARFQAILESGILFDLFNEEAVLDRVAVSQALKLDLRRLGIYHFEITRTGERIYDFKKAIVNSGGCCDLTLSDFPDEPPVGRFEGHLFTFPEGINRNAVIDELKRIGWEPADIDHMVAFGKKNLDRLREMHQSHTIGLGPTATVMGRTNMGMPLEAPVLFFSRVHKWEGLDGGSWNRYLGVRSI